MEGSDGLQEIRVLEMGAMKEEPLDVEIKREEDVDPNKRKLPPRRRGARSVFWNVAFLLYLCIIIIIF